MDDCGQPLQRGARTMRPTGHWLRAAAALVCAKRTMERVVDPIVSDMQLECGAAVRRGGWPTAAWVRLRGYTAFWKGLGLYSLQSSPRVLRNSLAADQWALASMVVHSLVAGAFFTLLLSAWPMLGTYSRFPNLKLTLLLLPQALPISIPIALSLGIVWCASRIPARESRIRRVLGLAIVATLLALAFVLMVPTANQAYRVAMAEELGLRGITKYSLPRGLNEQSMSELTACSHQHWAVGSSEWKNARRCAQQYHLRFALPAATMALSLFALAMNAITRRRVSGIATMTIGIAAYYVALMLADSGTSTPALPVFVSVWAPNVLFSAVSLFLLLNITAAPWLARV
ncbi:MAG TPA: LptF/LptG family permease, partial [Povalibacter sp.]|nr:LptF/LptG family permease [Povalibacter sp.]